MLGTTIKYQHVIQLDETKSGVEVYAKQVSGYITEDSVTPLFRITEGEGGKYTVEFLSDKVVILPKRP